MKLRTKFTGRRLMAGMLGLILVISLALTVALPAFGGAGILELWVEGIVPVNGAYFEQYTLEGSTGTGVFHPFLQVNKIGGHAQSPVYGYSTNITPLNTFCVGATSKVPGEPGETGVFYTTEPTYQPTLAELPKVTSNISGSDITYVEFMLDSNQNKGGDGNLLTWDQLRVYQTNLDPVSYFDLGEATCPLVWNMDDGPMGDVQLVIDGQFGSGSGQGDVRILIPLSCFDETSYTYVIAWVSFGGDPNASNPCDDDANEASLYPNNDGFEEFGYVEKPLGCLEICKTASWGGAVNPPAVFPTFTFDITGPNGYVNNDVVVPANDCIQIDDLALGDYTIVEDDPGPEWITDPASRTIIVTVLEDTVCAVAEFSNTYVPGCLEVTKKVDFSGIKSDPADVPDVDFKVTVEGPSYPAGEELELLFHLVDGELEYDDLGVGNATACLCKLIAGDYYVKEAPPAGWTVNITNDDPAKVESGDICGETAIEVIVENTPIPADVSVMKTGNITYTIVVHNAGPSDAANVEVNDPLPGALNWMIVSVVPTPPTSDKWYIDGTYPTQMTLKGEIATLASGETVTVILAAAIDGRSDEPLLGNEVTVITITPESDISNNIDWADIFPL